VPVQFSGVKGDGELEEETKPQKRKIMRPPMGLHRKTKNKEAIQLCVFTGTIRFWPPAEITCNDLKNEPRVQYCCNSHGMSRYSIL